MYVFCHFLDIIRICMKIGIPITLKNHITLQQFGSIILAFYDPKKSFDY